MHVAYGTGQVLWAPYPGAQLEELAWVPGYPLGLAMDKEGRVLIASAGVVRVWPFFYIL